MKKLMNLYGFLLFTLSLTLLGLLLLMNSANYGSVTASKYLREKKGGSMNIEEFLIIKEGYLYSYITLGGVMFFVGLLFSCLCLYKIFDKDNKSHQ
ncbi:hypothetical protein ACSVDA_20540 [Cytobacillus sp. Hm23]